MNISEEYAASIFWINPEDGGSITHNVTQYHSPEDYSLNTDCHKNLKTYKISFT
jgi:hypothetical protein